MQSEDYFAARARLIAVTMPVEGMPFADGQGLVEYCARVSAPRERQEKPPSPGALIRSCLRRGHWSILEMCNAVVEFETTRDISHQQIRHDFRVQEFSQRYAEVDPSMFVIGKARREHPTDRQQSIDDLEPHVVQWWDGVQKEMIAFAVERYQQARAVGIAKEVARKILPEGLTLSRLYCNGNLRTWLHYLDVREGNGTQLEHVVAAQAARRVLMPVYPAILGQPQD